MSYSTLGHHNEAGRLTARSCWISSCLTWASYSTFCRSASFCLVTSCTSINLNASLALADLSSSLAALAALSP